MGVAKEGRGAAPTATDHVLEKLEVENSVEAEVVLEVNLGPDKAVEVEVDYVMKDREEDCEVRLANQLMEVQEEDICEAEGNSKGQENGKGEVMAEDAEGPSFRIGSETLNDIHERDAI